MEWKDIVPVLAGAIIILVVAFVVKPALLGEPLTAGSEPVAVRNPPVYAPPEPAATPTPYPGDGPAYTRNFRWTAIDGGVHTTAVRIPEALFQEQRETPRLSDYHIWGRYALADADRPILEDLARRIVPPTGNPEEAYLRLMNLVFFVQQIPYDTDDNTACYIEGTLPPHAIYVKGGVEYPKYPAEMLVDGRGDCEDAAILMGGLLDALGYDTVLLRYSDHMALGIRMNEFNPYYAAYSPRHFEYEGKHYYYVEGTDFEWENVSEYTTAVIGRPYPIGNTRDIPIPSVRSETPEIIPLRYLPLPEETRIRQARLPAASGEREAEWTWLYLRPRMKIPKIAPDRKKALLAVGVVIAVMLLLVLGWTLFVNYTEERQVEVFRDHIAASEADLGQVSAKIIKHMSTPTDDLSLAECDAYVREFAAIADYGRAVTAYHRQIIAADTVPEAYFEAQAAYLRALDNLNRAFTFWLSAATAYDMRDYAAAEQNLARADEAWREYIAAIGDYEEVLRAAEEGGGEVAPA